MNLALYFSQKEKKSPRGTPDDPLIAVFQENKFGDKKRKTFEQNEDACAFDPCMPVLTDFSYSSLF